MIAAVFLLSACASAQPEVAAVIDKPTQESRAELAQAVSGALNGAHVTLADDALTKDSVLVIEKRPVEPPTHERRGQQLFADYVEPKQTRLQRIRRTLKG